MERLRPTDAVLLHPTTTEQRLSYLTELFGDNIINDILYELNAGAVSLTEIPEVYAPELVSGFEKAFRRKFNIEKSVSREDVFKRWRRNYEIANEISRDYASYLYWGSDIFAVTSGIALTPENPASNVFKYLTGKMSELTTHELFRHLKWAERAGEIIAARDAMHGRQFFHNMWSELISALTHAKMGEVEVRPVWSTHANLTNELIDIFESCPNQIPEGTHLKFQPIESYPLRRRLGGDIRFAIFPRIKDDKRAVLKYEEYIRQGKDKPLEESISDNFGGVFCIFGDTNDRDEFTDEILRGWFSENYPNARITEKRNTTGTKGKTLPLSWRRFKISIGDNDDATIPTESTVQMEIIVLTLADLLTQQYEIHGRKRTKFGDKHNGDQNIEDSADNLQWYNGRAHDLHESRRLMKLRSAHYPTEIYFPDSGPDIAELAWQSSEIFHLKRIAQELRNRNVWNPQEHIPLLTAFGLAIR